MGSVPDETLNQHEVRTAEADFILIGAGGVCRHIDVSLGCAAGSIEGQCATGIPCGRKDEFVEAQFKGTGLYAAAVVATVIVIMALEGEDAVAYARRVGMLVRETGARVILRATVEPRNREEWGIALTQGQAVFFIPYRQDLSPAPQPSGACSHLLRGEAVRQAAQSIASQQGRTAILAETLDLVGIEFMPAFRTFKVGQSAFGHPK